MTEEEKYNLIKDILEDAIKDLKDKLSFEQDNLDWDLFIKTAESAKRAQEILLNWYK